MDGHDVGWTRRTTVLSHVPNSSVIVTRGCDANEQGGMVFGHQTICVVHSNCQTLGTLVRTVQVEQQVFRRNDNTELHVIGVCGVQSKSGQNITGVTSKPVVHPLRMRVA